MPDPVNLSDRKLVNAFLGKRKEQAFRELYRRHAPQMYRVAYRFLEWRSQEAEDVLQEAWVRAAQKLPDFRWKSRLSTWLVGITINCCREALRQDRGGREMPEVPLKPGSVADGIDLERAIAALSERAREVLLLHDVEGFTHGEISELLGISDGTSKSQLHYARTSLKRRLSELEGQHEEQ